MNGVYARCHCADARVSIEPNSRNIIKRKPDAPCLDFEGIAFDGSASLVVEMSWHLHPAGAEHNIGPLATQSLYASAHGRSQPVDEVFVIQALQIGRRRIRKQIDYGYVVLQIEGVARHGVKKLA